MADDDMPGFIEDEPKPAAKPAKPAPPAAAFNPFGDVQVKLDATAAPGAAAEPAAKGPAAKGPAKSPGTGRTPRSTGAAPAAPSVPISGDADADVVPGQGKDLWTCPHCSARNKPGRDTCRSCGKTPDDEVA